MMLQGGTHWRPVYKRGPCDDPFQRLEEINKKHTHTSTIPRSQPSTRLRACDPFVYTNKKQNLMPYDILQEFHTRTHTHTT